MRKRRSKVTWFPNLGSTFTGDDSQQYSTTSQFLELQPEVNNAFQPSSDSGGIASLFCVPVTSDYTENPSDSTTVETLRDLVEGQDWLLRRIVGKCFVHAHSISSFSPGAQWPKVCVTAGFFVARALDEDQAQCGLEDEEVDPFGRINVMQPWIWRNQWILTNPQADTATITQQGSYRINNSIFAGTREGPQIDTKIARRITKEHRLWFAASVFGIDDDEILVTGSKASQPIVKIQLDIRILGAMRRGKNVSSF